MNMVTIIDFNTRVNSEGKEYGVLVIQGAIETVSVYSDDADPRSGYIDPLSGLTSFWHCQNGTV